MPNIIGTEENDFLVDSPLDDDILALGGDDEIIISSGIDNVDGGDGFDLLRLDFSQSLSGVTSFLTGSNSGEYSDGVNTVTFSNIEAIEIYGSEFDDVLAALPFDNSNPPTYYTMVNGGLGIDQLLVDFSSSSDDLNFYLNDYGYESGSLQVDNYFNGIYQTVDFYSMESFAISSGSGNDFLDLGYNNDSDDTVNAGAGDDFITPGLGIDNVDGGDGFDLLRLDYYQSPNGVTSFLTGSNSGEYSDGVNTVTFSNIEAIEVFGSQFDDVLAVLPSDGFNPPYYYPIIDGGWGIDQLLVDFSTSGDDLGFYLNHDYGYESGSLQVDNYSNGIYQNIDFYSMESFAITSGSGNDNLDLGYDNYSDDTVNAGAGDDYIFTGLGIDNVDGGEGFDILRLDYYQSPNGVTSFLTGSNSGQYSDGENTVTFSNIEAIEVFGSQFDDVLAALPSDNNNPPYYYPIIDGGYGIDQLLVDFSSSSEDLNFYLNDYGYESGSLQVDNYFNGTNQNIDFYSIESFAINSGSGNDNLDLGYGNYSNDTVNAGAGDDYIFTGFGIDNVDGGEGFDILRLDYYQSPNGVTSFFTGSNSGQFSDGENTVTFSNIEAIEVFGSQFDDVLAALPSDNNNPPYYYPIIDGGYGIDQLLVDFSSSSEDLNFYLNHDYGFESGSLQVENYPSGIYQNIDFYSMESFAITSGSGNDYLDLGYDNYSDDTVNAGAGDDYIFTGLGIDNVDGGDGFDILRLDYYQSPNGVTSFFTGSNSGQFSDGENTVTFSNIEAIEVFGSQFDDVLAALPSDNNNPPYYYPIIDGGYGIDQLLVDFSSSSEDLNFYLNHDYGFESGSLQIENYPSGIYQNIDFYSMESFAITSGSGNDNLDLGYDNYSDDTVNAGAGDDYIFTGLGIDNVDGGDGFDILRLDYYQSPNGVTSFFTGSNSGQFSDGENTVTFSNIEAIEVVGSQFDDVLAVLPFDSFNPPLYYTIIDGGWGVDQLLVDFSSSSDDMSFYLNDYGNNDGFLQVDNHLNGIYQNIDFYSIESFAINSGSGDDTVNAGAGDDVINSGSGNDTVNAGAGDDDIFTGLGIDHVDGGDGSDSLHLDYSQSFSGVTSSLTGSNSGQYSDGINTVNFTDIQAIEVIGSDYDDVFFGLAGNDLFAGLDGNDSIKAGLGEDTINGGLGNDTLRGDHGDDLIYGDEGIDRLYGKGNNDILYGGPEKDYLYGGNGNDTLYGGTGKDTMFGNAGADIFALEANLDNADRNVIKDFSDGEDRLGLTFGLAFEDLSITNNSSGSSTLIRDVNDNDLLAVINGIDAADITIDDFVNI